jgi:hypothetical protein
MKAVKLYKIDWNLDNLDPEERAKVQETLPTSKGFKADDNFDVVEKVPGLLKKKFGYDIKNYAYTEIPIYEDFETLLKTYTPRGEKPKKIYLKSGELSSFGEDAVNALKRDVSKRFALEGKGTADDEMSKQMDMIMLSLEKIFGIEWDEAENEDDIFAVIDKEINSHIKIKLKKMDDEEDFVDDEGSELENED